MNKKTILLAIFIALLLLGGGILVSFPFLVDAFVKNKLKKYPEVSVREVNTNYAGKISLYNLRIRKGNLNLFIDTLLLKPDYEKFLLQDKLQLSEVHIARGKIEYPPISPPENKNSLQAQEKDTLKQTFLEKANKLFDQYKKIIRSLPEKLSIRELNIAAGKHNLLLKEIRLKENDKIQGTGIYGKKDTFQLDLKFDVSNKEYFFGIAFNTPFSYSRETRAPSRFGFSETKIFVKDLGEKMKTRWVIYNLKIYDKFLAEQETSLDSLGFFGDMEITANKLHIESPDFFFNNFGLQGKILYKLSEKDTSLLVRIATDTLNAQYALQQIPESFRNYIQGMKLQGKISFSGKIFVQLGEQDKAEISIKPYLKNFKVLEYGKANLLKLNGDFDYKPYWGNRIIKVSPENPYFTKYENISPYLIDAVLTSEDGGFFKHKGFYEKALKESLIMNLRKGKFLRGGSTITMQLIKNVFLTHRKTLSRKFQEIYLTWLLEYFRLVPKKRMLEVYLNIIEWGPDVFGIGEAAEFYFRRKPKDIIPAEAIFLAMIIPRPRKFYYFFQTDSDSLKPYVKSYYEKVGSFMVKHGVLYEWQYRDLFPPYVWIIGEAKKYLPYFKKLNSR